MWTGFLKTSLSTATVTTRVPLCLAAAMAAARSIWLMMKPPNMSLCIFSSFGIASVLVARYPPSGDSELQFAKSDARPDACPDEDVLVVDLIVDTRKWLGGDRR
eukprot:CAMPEP_0118637632 /NCGR_PEP_ID=MMETSP0785-20121206/3253_1 /TAXON_ID=91992 /ORGANISM="Bolidomonas pacifica, Strain CCMP 1866" /LENGTH=103 /DNA_ID=CAMNT_0006528825 /DNA_START=176 /DNA_END=487 /DNA_ORIENTATION=-